MSRNASSTPRSLGFEEIYAKYRTHFVGVALSYVRDRMAAEDLVTESFLAYWQNRDTVRGQNVPAYILTSVRNRCLNWLRDREQHLRARRDIEGTEYRLMTQHIASLESDRPGPLFLAEVSAIIERELERMPERTRRVFIAHRYDEMSYKEIARLYGLSEGQIQYEIRTAKQMLRIALKDYSPLVALLVHHFILPNS